MTTSKKSPRVPQGFRLEHDSFGELQVPTEALYAAQTQRAVQNFPFSNHRMPRGFLRALGLIKAAAAETNTELGGLPSALGQAIQKAALEVAAGQHDAHFPVDVFQTGSGTSSNMNANEVIATLATRRLKKPVHPNDHVNQGQSSNDVVPTAIQVSALLGVEESLLPALAHLEQILTRKSRELSQVVKTGRTHLMDAMPLSFGQELSGWAAQIAAGRARLESSRPRLRSLPLGGTAVGTGVNADPRFAKKAIERLSRTSGVKFEAAANRFLGISSQDVAVELSGHLNVLAVSLMKITSDLRWMNSGPLAGLGEIELEALQPGSSIMPGKVNPVIPEAVAMITAQVMGNHTTITVAGASGNFQLNVMLPVIAHNLLESIDLLSAAATQLADRAIANFRVREDHVQEALSRNPILVTALNPIIGYEKAASLAKKAYKERRPILDVALTETNLTEDELRALLDPSALTRGGAAENRPAKKARSPGAAPKRRGKK